MEDKKVDDKKRENEEDDVDSELAVKQKICKAGMENLTNLINVLNDTLIVDQKGMEVTRKSVVQQGVMSYESILPHMDFPEHIPFFIKWYYKLRSEILDTLESDEWLTNSKIVIWFGEDVDEKIKRKNIKLQISRIHEMSLKIVRNIEDRENDEKIAKELSKEPEEDEKKEETSSQDKLLHDEILCYFILVLKYCLLHENEYLKDIPVLDEIIDECGENLGISSGTKRPKREMGANAGNGLLSSIKGVMRAVGMKGEDGNLIADSIPDELPENMNMTEMFSDIFNDESITKGLGDTMNDLNQNVADTSPENIGPAIGKAMGTMGPALVNTISRVMTKVPPPGVSDNGRTGTEEERRAEREGMQKKMGEMAESFGKAVQSPDVQSAAQDIGKQIQEKTK